MNDKQEAIARIIDPGSWMALENDGELDGSLWVNRRNLSMRKAASILRLLGLQGPIGDDAASGAPTLSDG